MDTLYPPGIGSITIYFMIDRKISLKIGSRREYYQGVYFLENAFLPMASQN